MLIIKSRKNLYVFSESKIEKSFQLEIIEGQSFFLEKKKQHQDFLEYLISTNEKNTNLEIADFSVKVNFLETQKLFHFSFFSNSFYEIEISNYFCEDGLSDDEDSTDNYFSFINFSQIFPASFKKKIKAYPKFELLFTYKECILAKNNKKISNYFKRLIDYCKENRQTPFFEQFIFNIAKDQRKNSNLFLFCIASFLIKDKILPMSPFIEYNDEFIEFYELLDAAVDSFGFSFIIWAYSCSYHKQFMKLVQNHQNDLSDTETISLLSKKFHSTTEDISKDHLSSMILHNYDERITEFINSIMPKSIQNEENEKVFKFIVTDNEVNDLENIPTLSTDTQNFKEKVIFLLDFILLSNYTEDSKKDITYFLSDLLKDLDLDDRQKQYVDKISIYIDAIMTNINSQRETGKNEIILFFDSFLNYIFCRSNRSNKIYNKEILKFMIKSKKFKNDKNKKFQITEIFNFLLTYIIRISKADELSKFSDFLLEYIDTVFVTYVNKDNMNKSKREKTITFKTDLCSNDITVTKPTKNDLQLVVSNIPQKPYSEDKSLLYRKGSLNRAAMKKLVLSKAGNIGDNSNRPQLRKIEISPNLNSINNAEGENNRKPPIKVEYNLKNSGKPLFQFSNQDSK